MALTAALWKNYSLKLDCWESEVGNRNTVTIRLHKDKKGNWGRVDWEEWSRNWRPRTSRSILGPKTRPMEILQHVPGEEVWGSILAEEPSERD